MSTLTKNDIEILANGRFITRVEDADALLNKYDTLDELRDNRYITDVVSDAALEQFIEDNLTYSYELVAEPTEAQITAATEVEALPEEVTKDSDEYVKINKGTQEDPEWEVYQLTEHAA